MTSKGKRFYYVGLAFTIFSIFFVGNRIATMQNRENNFPPPVPAPAAAAQFQPQIAKGANSTLVVWSDQRTVLGRYVPSDFAGLGGETDIYAARYDANGNLIDTTPIIISQAVYEQFYPHVAWNGQSWLVVWVSRSISNPNVNNVVGVRVAPDGTILDASPIAFSNITDSSDNPAYLDVTSDGANWVVVWGKGSYNSQIRGARLSPTGTLIDTGGGGKVLHNDANFTAPGRARLSFAGNQFLLVWEIVAGSGYDIRAQRFNNNLDAIGLPFTVNFVNSDANSPDVATDGTDFLVIWRENRFAYNEIFAARVSAAGQVLDPNGVKLFGSPGDYILPFNTALTWDGSSYVAAYHARPVGTNAESVFASRVSTTGVASAPLAVASQTGATQPAVAPLAGGGAQIVWADRRLSQDADIFGARLTDNTVGTASAVSLGAPRETHPRFTKTEAGNFALVYRSTISGESSVFLQRLNASGNQTGENPTLVISGSENITNPSVAWNGAVYLVTWELNGQTFGRRVAADGTTLGAEFLVSIGSMPDVAALGTQFLVVNSFPRTTQLRHTQATLVNGDATVGTPVRIGNNFDLRPRVRAFGTRWLVVWESDISHDNPNSTIAAAFVNTDGTSPGEFTISNLFADAPDLAVAGDTALVVWMDGGNIIGRRILADGTFVAPSSIIADTPSSLFAPKAAWDGARFVVAYGDSRNRATQPPADIYATRVGLDGTILTPGGFPVGASVLSEEMPAVEARNGATLFGFAKFEDRAPFAAFRIRVTSSVRTSFDFDGDGQADVAVFRPDNGTWYLQNSAAGFSAAQFGLSSDKLVPADYDGDGRTDLAVYRGGAWYLQRSTAGFTGLAFGAADDIPVPADFDGDGQAELAVFRPSNGNWYFYNLANNQTSATVFGQAGDKPVAADYDGDGKADVAVFRNGTWYIQRSQQGFTVMQFGEATDTPVPADYDGDAKADVAVFRPGNATWYLQRSQAGFVGTQFGLGTDAPVPADYDGDGKADLAVYRDGTWYLQRSTAGFTGVSFGAAGDRPIPNAFIP